MKLIRLAALGGAIWYLGDRRRRRQLRDRLSALWHRGLRRAERAKRGAVSEVYGLTQKATHLREKPKPQPNDATLKAKVETTLFRDADSPKGTVSVSAEEGIVQLRGEVDRPELIADLEHTVRSVQGVRDVENLLHLPGQEAKMHQAHERG
jgi:osmotically-inducible protein OsmY